MFQPAEITVALNGTLSQNPTIFHQNYSINNIFYEWKYNDEILAYGNSIPLKMELESSKITHKIGENVLTFSIKIGNINEAKTIASEDFHFYVTDCVTENSLSNAINSLPNNYDCGILSSSEQNRRNKCELEKKSVLLSDNTYAILSTRDNEFIELTTHKSIKNKTIDNNYNSISGRIEITHNDKTIYYVMDKDNFYSYISFYVTNSGEKLCATNIRASNVLKDGVDISEDQAELEMLASYFIALLYDGTKQDITYIDDIYSYNNSTFNYLFEDYKAGPYSIDGSVKIEKYGDNINDDPCKMHVKPNLTFKKDNDKIALSFEANYQISNKQYSNFELKSLIMNGKEFSTDKLSDSSIEKIKSFVGYLIQ